MRPTSGKWLSTIYGSHKVVTRVQAWYDGTPVTDVPIIAGTVNFDRFAEGRRRCQITVPLTVNGVSFNPRNNPRAPLASNGQRLLISTGVEHPDGTQELVTQGWFVITDWSVDETSGVVEVTGSDLWDLLKRAQVLGNARSLKVPPVPSPLLPLSTVLNMLVFPRMYEDPYPQDPNYPGDNRILGIVYKVPSRPIGVRNYLQVRPGDDRTTAILQLAEAWPAEIYVNDDGRLQVNPIPATPTSSTTPDIRVTDGTSDAPVITSRNYVSSRSKIANCVGVTAKGSAGGEIASAQWYWNSGNFSVFGPFGYATRLIETIWAKDKADCDAMAKGILQRSAQYTMTETLSVVPNPAVEINDVAEVTTKEGGKFKGLVTAIQLPLTADGGPMLMTVTNGDAASGALTLRETT
ncbi:DUF5047 domain-containing protein [Streptomyces alboflavus]|uniref:DUF5047 domain-containing protein n=1 Tax=Streptomyces alboflavus TaxID=67267 RepID=UPI00368B4325